MLTGIWPRMGALITAIPAPIAQAMLAGVVLQLCLSPVRGLASHPWQVTPILLTWLVFARFATRWAVPAAFVVTLAVIALSHHADLSGPLLPHPVWTTARLSWVAVAGVTVPSTSSRWPPRMFLVSRSWFPTAIGCPGGSR